MFRMRLERGQGLRRRHQHCPLRRYVPQAGSRSRTRCSSYHDAEKSELGVVYRCRAGATVAANVPSGPPDRVRKDVREWLDQVCHPAFRFVSRNHATLVRLAVSCYRLINLDVLLSNGTKEME